MEDDKIERKDRKHEGWNCWTELRVEEVEVERLIYLLLMSHHRVVFLEGKNSLVTVKDICTCYRVYNCSIMHIV